MLSIANFFKGSNVSKERVTNVLRTADNIINLNQTYINLKAEVEKMKQMKNNYSLNQNTNYPQLPPLGPLPRYYNW